MEAHPTLPSCSALAKNCSVLSAGYKFKPVEIKDVSVGEI
jgi:hypothetical protein